MPENAKLCLSCGSLEWYENYYASRTEYLQYTVNADGSIDDHWESGDDGDSEASGDCYCTGCGVGGSHLKDLDEWSEAELAELNRMPQAERVTKYVELHEHGLLPEGCAEPSENHCKRCSQQSQCNYPKARGWLNNG